MEYVLLGFVVLIAVWGFITYNKFVRLIEATRNSEKEIAVQLDRRGKVFDSLIATVQKYLDHEQGVFTKVTELRNTANDPNVSKEEAQNAENQLSDIVNSGQLKSGIDVTVEDYPELKSQTNMLQLQEEIVSTENKLTFAKKAFNNSVEQYFVKLKSLPDMILPTLVSSLNVDFEYWTLPDEQIAEQEQRRVDFN